MKRFIAIVWICFYVCLLWFSISWTYQILIIPPVLFDCYLARSHVSLSVRVFVFSVVLTQIILLLTIFLIQPGIESSHLHQILSYSSEPQPVLDFTLAGHNVTLPDVDENTISDPKEAIQTRFESKPMLTSDHVQSESESELDSAPFKGIKAAEPERLLQLSSVPQSEAIMKGFIHVSSAASQTDEVRSDWITNMFGEAKGLPTVDFPDLKHRSPQEVRSQLKRVFHELPAHGFSPSFKNPCFYYNPVLNRVSLPPHVDYINGSDQALACLPFAYILGQPRCGTYDLYDRLKLHPHVRFVDFKSLFNVHLSLCLCCTSECRPGKRCVGLPEGSSLERS